MAVERVEKSKHAPFDKSNPKGCGTQDRLATSRVLRPPMIASYKPTLPIRPSMSALAIYRELSWSDRF